MHIKLLKLQIRNTIKNTIIVLASIILIAACASIPTVNNKRLADKVYACSAGFGQDVAFTLKANFENAVQSTHESNLSKEIMLVTASKASRATFGAIFELLPEKDRLEGYKIYINCLSSSLPPIALPKRQGVHLAGDPRISSILLRNAAHCTGDDYSQWDFLELIMAERKFTEKMVSDYGVDKATYNAFIYCYQKSSERSVYLDVDSSYLFYF